MSQNSVTSVTATISRLSENHAATSRRGWERRDNLNPLITNQEHLDEGWVLVNGVRLAMNVQAAE